MQWSEERGDLELDLGLNLPLAADLLLNLSGSQLQFVKQEYSYLDESIGVKKFREIRPEGWLWWRQQVTAVLTVVVMVTVVLVMKVAMEVMVVGVVLVMVVW